MSCADLTVTHLREHPEQNALLKLFKSLTTQLTLFNLLTFLSALYISVMLHNVIAMIDNQTKSISYWALYTGEFTHRIKTINNVFFCTHLAILRKKGVYWPCTLKATFFQSKALHTANLWVFINNILLSVTCDYMQFPWSSTPWTPSTKRIFKRSMCAHYNYM